MPKAPCQLQAGHVVQQTRTGKNRNVSDIFISYAREDLERAKQLAEALEAQGWSVFWDRYIPPGKTWREVIAKALHEARCVVVAWLKASIVSGEVHKKAEEGHKRKILVTVFFEEVRSSMGFRGIQAASLVNWDGRPTVEEFQQLVSAVVDIIGSPKQPAEPRSPPQVKGRKGQRLTLWIAGLALGVVSPGWWLSKCGGQNQRNQSNRSWRHPK
jgi:hypothetical protein